MCLRVVYQVFRFVDLRGTEGPGTIYVIGGSLSDSRIGNKRWQLFGAGWATATNDRRSQWCYAIVRLEEDRGADVADGGFLVGPSSLTHSADIR